MEPIKTLFNQTIDNRSLSNHGLIFDTKNRDTERGEMMKYFLSRLNPSRISSGFPKLNYGRMGKILQGIPTKDLYYLKSVCDMSTDFSKRFWWELNPKNHKK